MENTQLDETQNETVMHESVKVNVFNPKNPKKTALIIAGAVIAIILIAFIINNLTYTKISLDEMCEITYSGVNGKGKAQPRIKFSVLNSMAETSDGIDFGIARLENTFKAEVSPNSELSNGDKITLTLSYDEALAKKYRIKVRPKTKTEKIKDLPEAEEVNPFDKLKVSFSGTSPFGKIEIDDSDCHDFVKNYVRFTYDNDINIENGAAIKIKAEYEQSNADNKLVDITETERDYNVEGLGEYVSDISGIDLSVLEQAISDEAEAAVSKARNKGAIFGMAFFANITFDVTSHYNYTDLHAVQRYFAYSKNPSPHSTCNKIYTQYEITVLQDDGVKIPLYFTVEANNIVKQTDGSIAYDSSLKLRAFKTSSEVTNYINANKDEYNISQTDLTGVLTPQI